MIEIVHGACRRSKVEDVIDRAQVEGLVDILLNKLKPRLVLKVFDVADTAGDEIVYANHLMAFGQQRITEMRANEACAPGYQNSHEIPFDNSLLASGLNTFLVPGIAVIDAPLYGGALFVVVPGLNQQVGRSILRTIITPEDAQSIFKGPSAPVRHFTISAPGCPCIIKTRPNRPYRDLIGMMLGHVAVEIIEIVAAPVAAIGRPSTFPGLHPGIATIKRPGIFGTLIFVNQ